jgi:hypothetical protein
MITLANDVTGLPRPTAFLDARLAAAIERAVLDTGLSVNINSTSGGTHSTWSGHYFYCGVDINRIDGRRVDDPLNRAAVQAYQDALARHMGDLAENFGPTRNEALDPRGAVVAVPGVAAQHQNHVHASTIRRDRP